VYIWEGNYCGNEYQSKELWEKSADVSSDLISLHNLVRDSLHSIFNGVPRVVHKKENQEGRILCAICAELANLAVSCCSTKYCKNCFRHSGQHCVFCSREDKKRI